MVHISFIKPAKFGLSTKLLKSIGHSTDLHNG